MHVSERIQTPPRWPSKFRGSSKSGVLLKRIDRLWVGLGLPVKPCIERERERYTNQIHSQRKTRRRGLSSQ